jgi:F-type H+-transporting ATPase subunit alpha
LAQFRELAAFAQFGSDLDAATKAKLDRGQRIVELFKQQQYQPKSLPIMVISLYAMQKGYFDSVAVDRVKEFQTKLETYLDERKSALVEKLGNEKTLDNVEADIKSALDDFKSSWK